MLAFNLGVFFRNLKGEEVAFSAQAPDCELRFTGGVADLHEETDLTRHLSVTLSKNELSLTISFEENEEEEPEDTEVTVEMFRQEGEDEQILLRATFLFGDISLKPASETGENEGFTLRQPADDEPEPA